MDVGREDPLPTNIEPQPAPAQRQSFVRDLANYSVYLMRRLGRDDCTSIAAALSYTSLLALVPLLAIALAMFAAFPTFAESREDLIQWGIRNLAPGLGEEIGIHLRAFLENAGRTTGIGILGLALTAVLLLHTIQRAFDRIFGATPGAKLHRLPIYWAVITLGPILFGVSLSITGYVLAKAGSTEFYGVSTGIQLVSMITPFILETIGFAVFYRFLPTQRVRTKHAVIGAIVAALLFEALKQGFGFYLANMANYEAVYGALATVPIFLIWMFLAWFTVLIGAEIAASLSEWRSGRRNPLELPGRGDALGQALGVLNLLRRAQQSSGKGRKTRQLALDLGTDNSHLTPCLNKLKAASILVRSDADRWVLARDLETLRLGELIEALNLSLTGSDLVQANIREKLRALEAAEGEIYDRPVAALLSESA